MLDYKTVEYFKNHKAKLDIVVGIPSKDNEYTIGFVADTVAVGLEKYFPKLKHMIVNSDMSTDETSKFFMRSSNLPRLHIRYRGTSGKGSALETIFELMALTRARMGAVVDADLRSISPEWIGKLITPVNNGCDMVVPLYTRYKYDGTITNHICYPLVYGLLGADVRQPIGGDFGFSKRMSRFWLRQCWSSDVVRFGVDIFMTTSAILNNFKIAQSALGTKVHDVRDPGESVGPMFRQVVNTLFSILTSNIDRWKSLKPKRIRNYGKDVFEPTSFPVNKGRVYKSYKRGLKMNTLKLTLSPDMYDHVAMGKNITSDIWPYMVYDSIYAFGRGVDIMDQLVALWYGRVYDYIEESERLDDDASEKLLREQAHIFRRKRNYLVDKFEFKF
ncbi:MAG: hypothetical protein ABIG39_05790 [Candidatus Micrarchaeota archaeon]